MRTLRAVLSGSFHRDPEGLHILYDELALANCQILSPFTPVFDNRTEGFVQTEGEKMLGEGELEQRHLAAIAHADFVWLHCPEGYVGRSAAFEIGFAFAKGIPVFAKQPPQEKVFQHFVSEFGSVFEALRQNHLL